MKKALTLLAALALSGCETTRYVSRACLTDEQFEKLVTAEPECVRECTKYRGKVEKGGWLTGDSEKDIRPISGSAIRLRDYSHGLLDTLDGCHH